MFDVKNSGTLNGLNQALVIDAIDSATVSLDIRGTFVGTLQLQGSIDDLNWVALAAYPIGSTAGGSPVTSTTAPGAWVASAAGCKSARVICTAYTSGSMVVNLRCESQGSPLFNLLAAALAAGSNLVGDVGIQYRGNATGAATTRHIVAAASTNATNVKNAAGRLLGWCLANTTAAWRYVKLHNSSAAPVAGASVFRTIGIPPNGVCVADIPGGIAFSSGIGFTIVTGAADTDATAVTANDVVGDLHYA